MRDDTPGMFTTVKEHMPKSHREYLDWTPSRIINWASTVGEATTQVVEAVMRGREHPAPRLSLLYGDYAPGQTIFPGAPGSSLPPGDHHQRLPLQKYPLHPGKGPRTQRIG